MASSLEPSVSQEKLGDYERSVILILLSTELYIWFYSCPSGVAKKKGLGQGGAWISVGWKIPHWPSFISIYFEVQCQILFENWIPALKKKNVLPWVRWFLRTKSLWSQDIGTSGHVPVDMIMEDETQSGSLRKKPINQKDLWKTGPWVWAPGIRTTFWCWQILTQNGRDQGINDVRWWSFLKTPAVK